MNQVPAIIRNPAHVEETESDGDVDPADLAPLISGNTRIITVPASRDEEVREEMEDMFNFLGEISEKIQTFNSTMQGSINSSQPPVVPDDKLWDTELAWERELNLYPNASRSVIISRLYNQVPAPEDEGARNPANLENRRSGDCGRFDRHNDLICTQ